MAYLSISNLYKEQAILLFKECYALEKIDGTSAHISWKNGELSFFSGGSKHETFVALFDQDFLTKTFTELGLSECVIFGESYGGKVQGMSHTYGKELRFVVFDIKIENHWLSVPDMTAIAKTFNLDVVDWVLVPTSLERLDFERDRPSVQGIKCGCGPDKPREGVVPRPPIEVRKNNGDRIIAKHKNEKFSERKTPQKVLDPAQLQILTEANTIADEWVTEMRLSHVLDKLGECGIDRTKDVLTAVVGDVEREAAGEIISSKEVRKAISKKTMTLFKARLVNALKEKA